MPCRPQAFSPQALRQSNLSQSDSFIQHGIIRKINLTHAARSAADPIFTYPALERLQTKRSVLNRAATVRERWTPVHVPLHLA